VKVHRHIQRLHITSLQLFSQEVHHTLSLTRGFHARTAGVSCLVADVGDLYTQAAIGCVDNDIWILAITVNTTAWHGMDPLELLERPQFFLLLPSAGSHVAALLDLEHLHHLVAEVVDDLHGKTA
ncbi:MAG: hypothetical protein WCO90_08755, partial [Planctomycetota bacterium]